MNSRLHSIRTTRQHMNGCLAQSLALRAQAYQSSNIQHLGTVKYACRSRVGSDFAKGAVTSLCLHSKVEKHARLRAEALGFEVWDLRLQKSGTPKKKPKY